MIENSAMKHFRLDHLPWPELRALAIKASRVAHREKAIAVARFALNYNSVCDAVIDRAIEEVRTGPVDSATRTSLQELVMQLDNVYFDAQEAGLEYLMAFQTARAANSALYAVDDDLEVAVGEAIYEAVAAVPDHTVLSHFLTGMLTV